MCPELSLLLWTHVQASGTSPDGKLFLGVRGGELPTITIRRGWTAARKTVLTPEELRSPLAKRIYDLRHACLSTWLNGGVPPTQVAQWAGHSVDGRPLSRRTWQEWRTKGRAPRCIKLPNGDLRIRRAEYERWLREREEAA
jgi:hypothetical protein